MFILCIVYVLLDINIWFCPHILAVVGYNHLVFVLSAYIYTHIALLCAFYQRSRHYNCDIVLTCTFYVLCRYGILLCMEAT